VRAEKKKKKKGLTGGAHRSALKPNRYGVFLFLALLDGSEGEDWEEAATGRLTGAAATSGEGAGRQRGFFSATSRRRHVGEAP
jgi:hypothetical protein